MLKYVLIIMFSVVIQLSAQNVVVISNEPVTSEDQGMFYYPQVSPTGESILFTSENYDGIWMYRNSNGMIEKIVTGSGAGYQPMYSEDGEMIVYRKSEFQNNRKYSEIHKYDLKTNSNEIIQSSTRNLSPPLIEVSNTASYTVGNQLVKKPIKSELQKSMNESELFITIENSDMVIYSDGERRIFTPLGKGNYIWPSVSPDGTKVLFSFAGKGSFVTDLDGNVILELGYSNYPSWSRDGKWIVYMEDRDDGVQITSSDIFVVSSDGNVKVNVSNNENLIEMYPRWSPSSDDIVYHSIDGIIYKLSLKID